MVGLEILEQRTCAGEDGVGVETDAADMDGCRRVTETCAGEAEWLREGLDQAGRVSFCEYGQGDHGGERVCGEEDWGAIVVQGAMRGVN